MHQALDKVLCWCGASRGALCGSRSWMVACQLSCWARPVPHAGAEHLWLVSVDRELDGSWECDGVAVKCLWESLLLNSRVMTGCL